MLYKWLGAAILCVAIPAFGQISQDRPELCGVQNRTVPLPPNLKAVASVDSDSTVTLQLQNSSITVDLPGPTAFQQVCPGPQEKLILFGLVTEIAYEIDVISRQTGQLLDSFLAYSPVMSPNQHWLALRRMYPGSSTLSQSEEYLLYDLTKDRAGNRGPGVQLEDPETVGRAIYPVGQKNLPADNVDLPEDQVHVFRSTSFYWAPDSQALVFGDNVQGAPLSVVLITIDSAGNTEATVHPIAVHDVCPDASPAAVSTSFLTISRAEISVPASPNGGRKIRVDFRSSAWSCTPKELVLYPEDFKLAKVEVHIPRKLTPAVEMPH